MKAFIFNQSTKSIIDVLTGKTLFFGYEDFSSKIVNGGHCFICGASPNEKRFNNEHVIPDWILREYQLHDDAIRLPNDTYFKYGSYIVPCCEQCNTELSAAFEIPISKLIKKGYRYAVEELHNDKSMVDKLFQWMCLLFFKTHLKDTRLLMERNRSLQAGNIGDYHSWENIHHIHCMSRAFFTAAEIDDNVYGSFMVLPALRHELQEQSDLFDYMDNLDGSTVMIRLDEICIFAVLNDSKLCQSLFHKYTERISGPLTNIQLREIFCHLVFLNTNLKTKPIYHSTIKNDRYNICATVPELPELLHTTERKSSVGELLHFYIEDLIPNYVENREKHLQSIKKGEMQFLLNESGTFRQY